MTVLRIQERLRSWRWIILFLNCVWLVACSEHIDIHKPIDVTKAGQSVKIDFEISKAGNYQFALLFDKGNDYDEEMKRRLELFGNVDKDGVITPVSLHLVKDSKIFFDKKINAGGRGWGQRIDYEGRSINMAVRNIKILELPPGRYSAVITTLENVPDFNGIESFVEFTYYDPKI
ncbi:DUF5625 family protein [Xenorhabdus bovienii]|uniref:DUF5625 family protein n=1 Tax=Xenorhabdus bovienii TaxID=40576 RepID=UPI00237CFC36|nr:DUF5625 family protein [Xenorhabdus bovienii]MDE1473993.1 DUF5625 family protein [Xenorhabdus bovienii]MDE9461069.1 DUF5625 family protein [Xenorhabdus bovienii]MDE9468194.1 DUF5625 family protein [Xenorhabdus bovienii]